MLCLVGAWTSVLISRRDKGVGFNQSVGCLGSGSDYNAEYTVRDNDHEQLSVQWTVTGRR